MAPYEYRNKTYLDLMSVALPAQISNAYKFLTPTWLTSTAF